MGNPFRTLVQAIALMGVFSGLALAQNAPPPGPAGYITLEESEVPVRLMLTGRILSPNATQLRPRVSGEITAILYTPGTMVTAGTALFSIDPLTYRTALAEAEATLARAEADIVTANAAFERVSTLRGSAASSQANYETAEANLKKARATRDQAEASLALARAQLDWTTLRAPGPGVVSVPQVAVGDLVTANQATALAEIVQIDPLQIDMTEPYPARLRIESRAERGEITLIPPELALILDDGSRIDGAARLISTAATVSATTGTRQLRFEIGNGAGRLAPGMFVQGELTVGQQRAILVPQRATLRERDGALAAWVAKDGKAQKRRLTEVGTHGNAWVVQAGLVPGDWLLIDGINNLRDGAAINPTPAAIDPQGVVRDAAPADLRN